MLEAALMPTSAPLLAVDVDLADELVLAASEDDMRADDVTEAMASERLLVMLESPDPSASVALAMAELRSVAPDSAAEMVMAAVPVAFAAEAVAPDSAALRSVAEERAPEGEAPESAGAEARECTAMWMGPHCSAHQRS